MPMGNFTDFPLANYASEYWSGIGVQNVSPKLPQGFT
jgi:hypothetical protein